MLTPWKTSYDQPRQHIKKQRHYFANKSLSSQGYGFCSSYVWMWELDHKESWEPKNWCFWTVVLEKILRVPWIPRRYNQFILKEISPECSLEGLMLKDWGWGWNSNTLATSWKSWLIGKDSDAGRDWGQEEKGTTKDEMAGWHYWLDRRDFEWTPGVGDRQRGLACCNSWGHKELDTTERLNWTDGSSMFSFLIFHSGCPNLHSS